jgi:hypothetical protein
VGSPVFCVVFAFSTRAKFAKNSLSKFLLYLMAVSSINSLLFTRVMVSIPAGLVNPDETVGISDYVSARLMFYSTRDDFITESTQP